MDKAYTLIGTIILILLVGTIFTNTRIYALFILSIILLIVIIIRNNGLKKHLHKPTDNSLNILNADKGGVFVLSGVGENSEELTLKVISKHLYQEGDYYWFELECDKGSNEKVWVEVEDDDITTVSVMLRKLTLSELGINSRKLEIFDDRESGSVTYKGSLYEYTDSDSAVFYRYCDSRNPQKFYYWEFKKGNHIITVEKWSDTMGNSKFNSETMSKNKDSYEVSLSQIMLPSQITVLSNKEEG